MTSPSQALTSAAVPLSLSQAQLAMSPAMTSDASGASTRRTAWSSVRSTRRGPETHQASVPAGLTRASMTLPGVRSTSASTGFPTEGATGCHGPASLRISISSPASVAVAAAPDHAMASVTSVPLCGASSTLSVTLGSVGNGEEAPGVGEAAPAGAPQPPRTAAARTPSRRVDGDRAATPRVAGPQPRRRRLMARERSQAATAQARMSLASCQGFWSGTKVAPPPVSSM